MTALRDANESSAHSPTLRVDKWLWCCRFFKSRAQATDAVNGGHVHVNGERAKASRSVKPGDRLLITREEISMDVVVLTIPDRRGPATEARAHYEETAESRTARERAREARRMSAPAPESRPDKHDRRLLRELRRR